MIKLWRAQMEKHSGSGNVQRENVIEDGPAIVLEPLGKRVSRVDSGVPERGSL